MSARPGQRGALGTDVLVLPSGQDLDAVREPVFTLVTDQSLFGETQPHQHAKAQLVYVMSGVITMEAAGGLWTVPPRCALWLPGGVAHSGRACGHVKIGHLYIEPALASSLRDQCGILLVQPLLRELILRLVERSPLQPGQGPRAARLLQVLLDELEAAPLEPLHLPMPQDRRLRRLAETLLMDPSLRFTIEEWGARVGASSPTLSRLFQSETGMSFVRFRHQLQVGLALQRLAGGEPVANIALDLGYESASAFGAMFRRMLGVTTARYFSEAGTAAAGPHQMLALHAT